MRDLLIGVLPVLGVVVGAFLQYVMTRSKDREAHIATLRHETYSDYLRAVSAIAIDRTPENVGQLVDAKSRMAIYASNAVIQRLAEFEISGATLADPRGREAFVSLAAQMRAEGSRKDSNPTSLSIILFGPSRTPIRPAA